MHTMYVDKPMQGAGLMQAIARVNRTFRDKPGGLIVDYIGVAQKLREALADYSPTDQEQAGVPIEQVVDVMLEKHDVIVGILHGHAWSSDPALPPGGRMAQLASALNFVLADDDRKARFLDQTLRFAQGLCARRCPRGGARDPRRRPLLRRHPGRHPEARLARVLPIRVVGRGPKRWTRRSNSSSPRRSRPTR